MNTGVGGRYRTVTIKGRGVEISTAGTVLIGCEREHDGCPYADGIMCKIKPSNLVRVVGAGIYCGKSEYKE